MPHFKTLIIGLPMDLRSTYYYRLETYADGDPLINDRFADLILAMLKNPLLAISNVMHDIYAQRYLGMLSEIREEYDSHLTDEEVVRVAVSEIAEIITFITDKIGLPTGDIDHYNYAKLTHDGIVLMHVDRIEEMIDVS